DARGGTVVALVATLGRSVTMRCDSSAEATDTPSAAAAHTATKLRGRTTIRSAARVPPAEPLPELGLVPARLSQALPRLVEVRTREQDRDHLLIATVPESEAPCPGRARSALGLEERGPRHAPDPGELRTARAVVIVDAE